MLFSFLTFNIQKISDSRANLELCISSQVSKDRLYLIHPIFSDTTGYALIIDPSSWTAELYNLKFQFIQRIRMLYESYVGGRCLYLYTNDARQIYWQTYQNMYLATELTLQPAKFIQSSVLYLANQGRSYNLGIQLLRTKVQISKQIEFTLVVFYNHRLASSELALFVEGTILPSFEFSFMEGYKFVCSNNSCVYQVGGIRLSSRAQKTLNNFQFYVNISGSRILSSSAKQVQQRFMFRINGKIISKDCKQFNLQLGCLLCSNYLDKATKLCVADCIQPNFSFTSKSESTGLKGKYCAKCQIEQQSICVLNCSNGYTLDRLGLTCERLTLSPEDNQSSPNRGGLIAGIIIASLATVLIVVGVYRWCKRAKASQVHSIFVGTRSKQSIQKSKEYIQRESGQNLEYECVICLQSQSQNLLALNCGHRFHQQCIHLWMKKNDKCPVCRAAL